MEGGGKGLVEILLVGTCYRNRNKGQPDGPLGSFADLTSTSQFHCAVASLSNGCSCKTFRMKMT